MVTSAGLGTLNTTELTPRELTTPGLELPGVVIGSRPADPDLAARCNLTDVPEVTGTPLPGALPQDAGAPAPREFRARASDWLGPTLQGTWDYVAFTARHRPASPCADATGEAGRTRVKPALGP